MLVRRLRTLIDDASLRQAFGEAGRLRVADGFSAERLATDHDRLYRSILSG